MRARSSNTLPRKTAIMKFTLNEDWLRGAVSMSLEEWARFAVDKIVDVTPRDPKRLPINPKAKVTGALRRSIDFEKVSDTTYKVGVVGAGVKGNWIPISVWKGATPAEYGYYQEFGTIRMKPRSFIRKTYFEKSDDIINHTQKTFNILVSSI